MARSKLPPDVARTSARKAAMADVAFQKGRRHSGAYAGPVLADSLSTVTDNVVGSGYFFPSEYRTAASLLLDGAE